MESTNNRIKAAGLKVTPQRKILYETMLELRHATVEEIINHVQAKDSAIMVATIYRILDSFCQAHLLSLVFHPDLGKKYYDITPTGHHHVFEGKRIVDYMDDKLTEMIRQYLKENHFTTTNIDDIQVQITINNSKLNSKK
jgi:Fe2+ or Zn2+ uptake regulation protein